MCFEGLSNRNRTEHDDDLGIEDIDDNNTKDGKKSSDLEELNESLHNLLDGIQIPYQMGVSKVDLQKVVKSSLSGVDKSISTMYKKLQKNLASEELLPSLWEKCKTEFLDKYDSFAQLVAKIYPGKTIPSVSEMRDLLASM